MSHTPVLLQEVIEALDPQPGQFIVDGTMDGGGHAAEILKRVLPDGKLLGMEWDAAVMKLGQKNIADQIGKAVKNNLVAIVGNYADLPEIMRRKKLPKADALLLDLGFSSEKLESSGRGFSFQKNEPLLMTYDDSKEPVSAIVRRLSEEELANVIYELSGERFSRRIAKAIKETLRRGKIETTHELRAAIKSVVPRGYERGRIDPATRTFQALRIYANHELENVSRVLANLEKIVRPGGRAAIITFHSLEDGLVKRAFREMAKENKGRLIAKKPIVPQRAEIMQNPRSRSAKLRIIELAS